MNDRDEAIARMGRRLQAAAASRQAAGDGMSVIERELTHGGIYDELAQIASIVGTGHFDHREVGKRIDRVRERFYDFADGQRGAVEALANLGDPAWARGAGGASMAEYARRELRALGIEPRGGQSNAVCTESARPGGEGE